MELNVKEETTKEQFHITAGKICSRGSVIKTEESDVSVTATHDDSSEVHAHGHGPTSSSSTLPQRSIEGKRQLIRKHLVLLLHAISCGRQDINPERGSTNVCNVPFCGLVKPVIIHLNSCKTGETCCTTHCSSSKQILLHWKNCVKVSCPVCVTLRSSLPAILLKIFPTPLCRAELHRRSTSLQSSTNITHGISGLDESEE